jgi:hypothetical protein
MRSMNEFIHVKDAEENMNIDEFFCLNFLLQLKFSIKIVSSLNMRGRSICLTYVKQIGRLFTYFKLFNNLVDRWYKFKD